MQKGQEHPHQYPDNGNSVDSLPKVEESLRGKTVSFQIDNTTVVAYLLRKGGTHCMTSNGLVRKILLKCHVNRIMVCPVYLRGVANFQGDALSRDRKTQDWSLGDPASHRLFRCWGTPVVDLFTSNQVHKVSQYFSLHLSDKRATGE